MVAVQRDSRGVDRTLALLVAGVGDSTAYSYSAGVCFCSGNLPAQGTFNAYWIRSAIRTPDNVAFSIKPYLNEISGSAFDFEIVKNAQTGPLLLDTQRRAVNTITSLVNAGATTVFISGTNNTGLASTVVWAGDEAILLGTHAGGGRYDNCERGYWSTTAQRHFANDYVSIRNPHLQDRKCYLIEYDAGGTAAIVDRGMVTVEPYTTPDGLKIRVEADSIVNLLAGAQINRGARTQTTQGLNYIPDPSGVLGPQLSGKIELLDVVNTTQSSDRPFWLQVGNTIAVGTANNTSAVETDKTEFTANYSGRLLFGDAEDLDVGDENNLGRRPPFSGEVSQLFVVVRSNFGNAYDLASSYELGDNFNNAAALAYAFMRSGESGSVSGYDAWRGEWGAGYEAEFFDTTQIEALIDENDGLEIDQLVLGWNAESISIEALALNWLMRARGLFLGRRDDGRITFNKLGPLTIEDFAGASAVDIIPGTLQRIPRAASGYNSIDVEIGGLPWNDPDPLSITSRDGTRRDAQRKAIVSNRRTLTYDLRTERKGQDETALRADLVRKLQSGIDNAPRIRVQVLASEFTGVDLDVGGYLKLNAPDIEQDWWIRDGQTIAIDPTDPGFTGRIVSYKKSYATGRVDVELLLTADKDGAFVRWRAPSGVVSSYNAGGPTITLEANAFHDDAADASFFTIGDFVDAYHEDGEPITTDAREITNIAGNVITLASAFSSAPSSGKIIRLAKFPAYGDGGEPVAGAGRAFVFAADVADGKLDNGNTAGDIYG